MTDNVAFSVCIISGLHGMCGGNIRQFSELYPMHSMSYVCVVYDKIGKRFVDGDCFAILLTNV